MEKKKSKRRKTAYVPYDYEAAYQNQLVKMEEANAERLLREGRAKNIYATKEIRSGDQLEIEIYPEFSRGSGHAYRMKREEKNRGRRRRT